MPSVLTAQLDRERVENSVRLCSLKFLDCETFETAEVLTAHFTLDCSVCCVLKAEAQFANFFNAVNISLCMYTACALYAGFEVACAS